MAKTYTNVPSVNTGDVYSAADYNTYTAQNVNNLIVPPSVSATRSAVQSIVSAGNTFISFTVERFDTDEMFAPTDTKITINTAGVYLVTAFISYDSNGTGLRLSFLEKNAASAGAGTRLASAFTGAVAADEMGFSFSTIEKLNLNDTLHLTGYQTSGSPLNTGPTHPKLSATWIGNA